MKYLPVNLIFLECEIGMKFFCEIKPLSTKLWVPSIMVISTSKESTRKATKPLYSYSTTSMIMIHYIAPIMNNCTTLVWQKYLLPHYRISLLIGYRGTELFSYWSNCLQNPQDLAIKLSLLLSSRNIILLPPANLKPTLVP